jgi:alkylhydroperoxidase family enzyme
MKSQHSFVMAMIISVLALACAVSAGAQLPRDVYPDSRNRLPLPKREELDDVQKKAYDEAFAKTKSLEGLRGEAGIVLHGSSGEIRFESPAGRRLTEMAILVGARNSEQNFEWSLHVGEALRQGVEREIIDIIRLKKPVTGLGEKETAIITLGREMAEQHRVAPATFANALKVLGKAELVDLAVTLATRANETPLIWVDQHMPVGFQPVAPLPINIIESPPDIFPISRSRLREKEGQRPPTPGRTLSPAGMGPGQIALHQAGGKYLDIMVGKPLRELAVLAVARELDQQVMWTEHEPVARKLGVSAKTIETLRDRKPTTGLSAKESMVIQMVHELIALHHVAPETFAKASDMFGERDALDLATEIGDHARTAAVLTVFDQHLPAGVKPLLPLK